MMWTARSTVPVPGPGLTAAARFLAAEPFRGLPVRAADFLSGFRAAMDFFFTDLFRAAFR
jgi:hypothetical protein